MHQPVCANDPKNGQVLLVDAKLALALLDLGESTNIEERRFCAILKAEEVVGMMNQALLKLSGEHDGCIEKARDELQNRLDRALAANP